ncbi:serine hydrolase domain-containing protein [Mycobacterium sp. 1274756.6]|uniref:serine hydrolase domain-containing protein n=1 Tax=Mycobacterium sp. 1274756.6 TaxID=1834076 RepID=UPI0007FC1921|nr:serine hydrolase domain-containing protein [Mycobacterium sp. 1274756.6]OBJ67823.1 serine hydrolase [Mycobacterium sp. 1274756.6]
MPAAVGGDWTPRFARVAEALAQEVGSGGEIGAAIAVNVNGVHELDIWAGYADTAGRTPWGGDTIVNLFSSTKTVTSLAALVLVDRGVLDLESTVARYWPEFAANGKGDINVGQVLGHTSGVPGWDAPFTLEDMYDWDTATARLAAQAPWWSPGSRSGYHATSYGHLVGELIRRTTGMSLKEFVRREIAAPLDANFQIGAAPEDTSRIAELTPPPRPDLADFSSADVEIMRRTFANPPIGIAATCTAGWRAADLGAVNGHGNASGLARILSPLAMAGAVDGLQLLRPATVERIFEVQADGVDLVLGVPLRFGNGFALSEATSVPYIPTGDRIAFWGGWGGSMVVIDADHGVTIAYTMNRMGAGTLGSERTAKYVTLIYEALG